MKKVLLAGTALLGLAAMAAPAQAANVDLSLGGYFSGYGVFSDQDEPAGVSYRKFDLRRDTEVHVNGEATTDHGLTVGYHAEADVDAAPATDEVYAYFSGGWGRVNLGAEDGAAYLLQVAAPSADSNVDGLRVYIQALNSSFAGGLGTLDYDHADFRQTDKITYLTPKFNGFQAGVSYAPEIGFNAVGNEVAAMALDNSAVDGNIENIWEAAARWDGEFQGFGISAGGGYSRGNTEVDPGAIDDLVTWNAGLNLTFSGFSLGGAFLTTNNGLDGNFDSDTWVVGGAWDNGPYHVGASYLNQNRDNAGTAPGSDFEVERFAVGGGYTYGPGMSFRGAVAIGNSDDEGTLKEDFTQVTVGTEIDF